MSASERVHRIRENATAVAYVIGRKALHGGGPTYPWLVQYGEGNLVKSYSEDFEHWSETGRTSMPIKNEKTLVVFGDDIKKVFEQEGDMFTAMLRVARP